jgi:serine/threonine-protein kinase
VEVKCAFSAGSVIANKFEVIKKTGEGSLGDDIYLGFQKDLKREVTIRILPREVSTDKEMVNRFVQEIEITAALQHPNILPAYEAGEFMGRAYLVTAPEVGIHLNEYLKENGAMPEKEAVKTISQIAGALQYAWNKEKVLHRNIRPESILISEDQQPILEDFGMAKTLSGQSADLTMVGFTIGNPEYMSPEQTRGETDLDCRSDIYCLGLVFYEMLTGHPTFQATNQIALMQAQLSQPHTPVCEENPDLSKELSAVIDRMLTKNREDRYAQWGELIDDLKALAEQKPLPSMQTDEVAEEDPEIHDADTDSEIPVVQERVEPVQQTAKTKTAKNANSNIFVIIGVVVALIVIGGAIAFILMN